MDEASISRGLKSKRQASAKLSYELTCVPTRELAVRIRGRDLSPVEVVEAFIRRIEARNPSLNALVYLNFDSARACSDDASYTAGVGLVVATAAALGAWCGRRPMLRQLLVGIAVSLCDIPVHALVQI